MVAPERLAPLILVVEDEVLVRTDVAETLIVAGFLVLQVANADEAIRVLESRNDIQLVLTDIGMPGSMDGLKLAQVVASKWPPVRLLVMSARSRPAPADLPEGAQFHPKPFPPSSITAAVASLLGRAPPNQSLH